MVSVRPSGDSVQVDSRENVFASPPSLPGSVVVDVVTRRSPPSVALVTVVEPRWSCSVRSEPSATNNWLYERSRLSRAIERVTVMLTPSCSTRSFYGGRLLRRLGLRPVRRLVPVTAFARRELALRGLQGPGAGELRLRLRLRRHRGDGQQERGRDGADHALCTCHAILPVEVELLDAIREVGRTRPGNHLPGRHRALGLSATPGTTREHVAVGCGPGGVHGLPRLPALEI